MLRASAVILTACLLPPTMSINLNVTGLSCLFITTTTTVLLGVRNAIASRDDPTTTLLILTEPRGTNLLVEHNNINNTLSYVKNADVHIL